MSTPKSYNVKITDKEGSFTIGYWFVEKKSIAVREAKLAYPPCPGRKYKAILKDA